MGDRSEFRGKWYERIAWVLLLVVGLPFLLFGVSALLFGLSLSDFPVGIPGGPEAVGALTGQPWEEVLAENAAGVTLLRGVSRMAGLALLGFAVLILLISTTAFRRGERWAWFAMLVVPGFMFGLILHELDGGFVHMPTMFLTVSLAGLLLPIRVFFGSR